MTRLRRCGAEDRAEPRRAPGRRRQAGAGAGDHADRERRSGGWELVREVFPRTGPGADRRLTGPPGVGEEHADRGAHRGDAEGRTARSPSSRSIRRAPSPAAPCSAIGSGSPTTSSTPGSSSARWRAAARLGGLSEATLQAALLMDASGKDDVFIETVGVGQAEIDIVDHGDTIVLVLMPGSGDSIQALKAGVMEIPDVICVNKADHPMTDTMIREIRGVLSLGPPTSWRVPIVRTEAAKGEGVAELAEKIAEHRAHIEAEGTLEERRARNLRNEVLELAAAANASPPGGSGRGRRVGPRAARPRGQAGDRSGERRQGPTGARGWLSPRKWARPAARTNHRGPGGRPRRLELSGDHHLLDLVGPLADGEDLRVAVEAADRDTPRCTHSRRGSGRPPRWRGPRAGPVISFAWAAVSVKGSPRSLRIAAR